ncbi:hypothetical protein P755_gp129 [Mycobacterium phage Quink]|uniref:Uncharacterized protein n=6 Tax=Kostyavirus TaxID=1623284 RepID=A0A0H4TIE7_9CAUD|nr:hypothetical protein PBI_MURPHY_129 [Mycobacterium phage Murphy]YP_008052304.1 hypothetical protein M039_gp124 [Mycobacterium phage Phaux]YP_008409525.1 hypothetical protein DRDREY_134 [Mycobacterium phage DrDrey]YP_008531208.1 hypothetical protein P755_gp129 [Mycobacterium phage Quink]YP_009197794.1 hypothetical protein SEA_NELITZAMV_128 [Mycobacterium phage NelitzaMV]YP_009224397.1 hypothetical protein SEA_DUSK_131 [Mycobacterium phage Dusk]YP_009225418.1 hypothetical protein SEA_MINDY_1
MSTIVETIHHGRSEFGWATLELQS